MGYGLCGIAFAFALGIAISFLPVPGLHFTFFFPLLTGAFMHLGMRGQPAALSETVLVLALAIGLTLFMYFAVGVGVGYLLKLLRLRVLKYCALAFILSIVAITMRQIHVSEVHSHNEYHHVGYTPEDCEQKSEDQERHSCYKDIYPRLPPDPRLCEKFVSDFNSYLQCASDVGTRSGDIALCKTFFNPQAVDECLGMTPLVSGNSTVCKSIVDPPTASHCYRGAAVISRDYAECSKILPAKLSKFEGEYATPASCVIDVALATVMDCRDKPDSSAKAECFSRVCSSAPSPKSAALCYLNAAVQTGEQSYCSNIADGNHKARCIEYISELEPSEFGADAVHMAIH